MDFALNREDSSHPLIQALTEQSRWHRVAAAALPRSARSQELPRHSPAPKRTIRDTDCCSSPASVRIDPETMWLGRTLGKQVSRLLGRQLLAETRFGQERMLLYSIINAVTDPILLTDTESKLIIANSHAEKLFAAPDEASEGWRRAAALNNMLFSAALSTARSA